MIISIIRTGLMYLFVIFAIRIMGKRQLSDMQTSELVVTMIIADIASIPMQNTSQPLLSGIVPVLILISGEIFLSVLMLKIPFVRDLFCGKPEIIIENGILKQSILRRLRLTTEDLSVLLRQQGVFRIEDVQFCIIETNGQISVLLKSEKRTPSMEDMGLPARDTGIEAVIISDGEMLSRSMALCDVDELWIKKTLAKENIRIDQIMLMTANRLKEYNIIRKC